MPIIFVIYHILEENFSMLFLSYEREKWYRISFAAPEAIVNMMIKTLQLS